MEVRDLSQSYRFREYLQNRRGRGFLYPRRRVILATFDNYPVSTDPNNDLGIQESPDVTSPVTTQTSKIVKDWSNGGVTVLEQGECSSKIHPNPFRTNFGTISTGTMITNARIDTTEDHQIHRSESREKTKLKDWIKDRKILRQDLQSLGLNEAWLERKPRKSENETRVLRRMLDKTEKRKSDGISLMQRRNSRRLSSAHIDFLPLVHSPLPIALALIADYLGENRLRLVDLFSKVDKNKDWLMTREELKKAFKRIQIPLSDVQLDHLIVTLDINNDNQLSYKEIARGIEAYHKDRRWQKMKEMYDNAIAEETTVTQRIRTSPTRKSPVKEFDQREDMYHLEIPQCDFLCKKSQNIYIRKMARDRRKQQLKEKKDRNKRDTGSAKQPSVETTLRGVLSETKIKYLTQVNNECRRCIDQLHSNGILIPSATLEHVLIPPSENMADKCNTYLSSSLSAYPYNHSLNIEYRKQQARMLRRYEREKRAYDNQGSRTSPDGNAEEDEQDPHIFLPRVASSYQWIKIGKEGRKKRLQIERASPTPYWPQHLLDKLCLCMDGCKLSADGKSVLFNCVTEKKS